MTEEGAVSSGLPLVDLLASKSPCTLDDYIGAASEYVRRSRSLASGPKKAAQIRLSNGLGHALVHSLTLLGPQFANCVVGEREISGALRRMQADVSEIHPTDGLRLAVELKPVNLAVGRAIWNRFGDIRTFAVNVHLKFPFAVVGGVLTFPTYEWRTLAQPAGDGRTDTTHLIRRAVLRLMRAGGRRTEGDAPHLLEGVAVVVYDPDTGSIVPDLPPVDSGLRWEAFTAKLVEAYMARFED
jgi:hypothetical protein